MSQPLGCSGCFYWSDSVCAATGLPIFESRYPGVTKADVDRAAKKGIEIVEELPGPCGSDTKLWTFA